MVSISVSCHVMIVLVLSLYICNFIGNNISMFLLFLVCLNILLNFRTFCFLSMIIYDGNKQFKNYYFYILFIGETESASATSRLQHFFTFNSYILKF
jgi:hypothetical protein